MAGQCQYKIRWTWNTDARCERDHHIDEVRITERPMGFEVETIGDGQPDTHIHKAKVGPAGQTELTWQAGDRREFTGDWPGECTGKVPGCVLPVSHHGRCAP